MEIRKYKYEILDFNDKQIFRAQNDDVAEKMLEDFAEKEVEEVAQEALEEKAQASDEQVEGVSELPPEPSFSQEEMDVAKSLAREGGIREGLEQAKKEAQENSDKLQEQVSTLLQSINALAKEQVSKSEQKFSQIENDYSKLALSVAKKVLGDNKAESLADEMLEIIKNTFTKIGKKEELKLILNPEIADALKGKFEDIEIIPDETILSNDFKIEWQNGFAQRKTDEIWRDIEQIINVGEIIAGEEKDGESKEEVLTEELVQQPEDLGAQEVAKEEDSATEDSAAEVQSGAVEEANQEKAEEIIEEDNITNKNKNEE